MEILNTKETANKILEIIKEAKEYLIIVSPFLKMKEKYKKEIERKKIKVIIIYGKSDLNYDEEDFMYDCDNIGLYYCDDLHAKIYMNENECIISSMNLYQFSEENNFELSVVFDKNEKKAFKKVEKEIREIKENSIKEKKAKIKNSKNGYCIRTGKKIKFNPEKPFCYEAFIEWNIWKNPFFKENFCHYTGKKSYGKTSFNNPIL